jgi:hypothetical protein
LAAHLRKPAAALRRATPRASADAMSIRTLRVCIGIAS